MQGTDVGRTYDMLSLMHYGGTAFSTDYPKPTITPKDKAYERYCDKAGGEDCSGYTIGNRLGMTSDDAEQLAAQYGCVANRLSDETSCTDAPNPDGTPWTSTAGEGCDTAAEWE